jgi:DNA-binding PadR family transcriptional regulator
MSPRPSSAITVEHILLALLDQKSMHGYELYQELCKMKGISLVWNIKQSLLYAILDKLEQKDFLSSHLIQGDAYPPRKYFHLTEIGKSSLQEWIETPVRRARDLRQEFLAKVIIARRYGKPNALELIRLQQQTCQAWLNDLEKNIPSSNQESVDEWFVYTFRVNRVEGDLMWLKSCEREIDRLPDPDR